MIHLILAAGKNKRFKDSAVISKSLLPVLEKPIIQHQIDYNKLFNFSKTTIVVKDNKDEINKSIIAINNIQFVHQDSGEDFISGIKSIKEHSEATLLTLCDEYVHMHNLIEAQKLLNMENIVLCYEKVESLELVKKTYSFSLNNGIASDFQEKPQIPLFLYRGTGHIFFSKKAIALLNCLPTSIKNIDDLLNFLTKNGITINTASIGKKYFNINTIEDFEELNLFLNNLT